MSNRRCTLMYLGLVALVVSILACNAPTPTPVGPPIPSPTVTAVTPTSTPEEAPPPTDTPSEATSTSEPPQITEETPTSEPPAPTETPPSPTATPTPSAKTATPTPTTMPTQPPPGETLIILDPGFEIADWQALPETGEWEGHLRILFTGGVPPYTSSMQDREPQSENYHYIRWAKCRPAVWRANVWSADGQYAHKDVYIEAPWCP
jgi:outer membrane biosynthesis protein TonB